MTVLKKHPSSFLRVVDGQIVSLFALTLTEGNGLNPFAHTRLLGKPQKVSNWIRTSREHKDQRSLNGRVLVAFGKIKSGRYDESLTHFVSDPVLNGGDDFIRSEGFDNEHFLEVIKFFFPVIGEGLFMSVCRVKDMFKLFRFFHEVLIDALKVF
jgi:hypothetical protein